MGYFLLAKDVWTCYIELPVKLTALMWHYNQDLLHNKWLRTLVMQLPVYIFEMNGFHMNPNT